MVQDDDSTIGEAVDLRSQRGVETQVYCLKSKKLLFHSHIRKGVFSLFILLNLA